jgi:hypothetical protein
VPLVERLAGNGISTTSFAVPTAASSSAELLFSMSAGEFIFVGVGASFIHYLLLYDEANSTFYPMRCFMKRASASFLREKE